MDFDYIKILESKRLNGHEDSKSFDHNFQYIMVFNMSIFYLLIAWFIFCSDWQPDMWILSKILYANF
jgi:hypothetical protein